MACSSSCLLYLWSLTAQRFSNQACQAKRTSGSGSADSTAADSSATSWQLSLLCQEPPKHPLPPAHDECSLAMRYRSGCFLLASHKLSSDDWLRTLSPPELSGSSRWNDPRMRAGTTCMSKPGGSPGSSSAAQHELTSLWPHSSPETGVLRPRHARFRRSRARSLPLGA